MSARERFESLPERIAALEAKAATHPGVAKDLKVIELQLARAEEKLRALATANAGR